MKIVIFVFLVLFLAAPAAAQETKAVSENDWEIQCGLSFLKNFERSGRKLVPDRVTEDYLRDTVGKVISVNRDSRGEYFLHLYLDTEGEISASGRCGGQLFFSSAILKTDAEGLLVFFVAHEMVHSFMKHDKELEDIQQEMEAGQGLLNKLAEVSRFHESKADQFALWSMMDLGYNPECVLAWFSALPRAGKTKYDSHPPNADRIAVIQKGVKTYKREHPQWKPRQTNSAAFYELQKHLRESEKGWRKQYSGL